MADTDIMITAAQIRAARGLLNWSRKQLAEAAGVSHSTINDYENGRTDMLVGSMRKIIAAFASAGVEFTDADKQHGAGVRWKAAQ